VDDDADLRATILDAATYLGMDQCVAVGSLAEVEQQRGDALECSLAVIDINLGQGVPSGVDVYHWLEHAQFHGRVVFLTGHGSDDPRVQEAARIAGVPVLTKPIGIADIAALAGAK
jgi:ActR/RegA family two-component response regulator